MKIIKFKPNNCRRKNCGSHKRDSWELMEYVKQGVYNKIKKAA